MSSELSQTYDELLRAIRTTRRRWRLKVLLRGLAAFLAAGLATVAISVWALDRFRYGDTAVAVVRILVWVALAALAVRFLVLPLLRRVSDRQVALYIEEHEPSLEAELLSAIELGARANAEPGTAARAGESDRLVESLVERAIESCQTLDMGASIERSPLRKFSALAAGSALAVIAALLLSPAFLQHGSLLLFLPWRGDTLASPYGIEVTPGSVTVARGADLEVKARLVGFETDAVELAVRRGEGGWERWPMPGEGGERISIVLDLQEPSEYFVEAGGVRSGLHRVEVADVPYVDRLDLEYRFPAYTGLAPQRIEDGGDIAALRGTEVRVEVTSTVPVARGRLMIEQEDGGALAVDLVPAEGGLLVADLTVERDTFYRIELPGPEGSFLAASPEYAVEVMEDQPPVVSFTTPGRDVRAHKLEEVFTQVRVEDDYGVARLELVFAVNGGEEQTLTLLGGSQRPKQFEGGHTFYLEELDLVEGDFISYFARASESGQRGRAATVTTDIYFVEISPFTKNYRQAEQGAGGMDGAQQMDNALSLRQRQIVAATFKLVRDRAEFDPAEYGENLTTVALMQGRLREQVETLVVRMRNRLRGEEDFQAIAEDLTAAAAEMGPAQQQLAEQKPKEALGPEQRALKFLQRAEARFRDVQVAFQQGGGMGGGEAQRMAEDLADLFELELDKLHKQYETVERGERQAVQEEVDEALERLEELARRQEQENERARRLPSQMAMSGAAGQSQRQLVEETEELARRLERLARERSRPDLAQTARRLQQAADAMRKAMANRSSSEMAQGTEALEQLRDARRLLERNREFQLASEMEDLDRRAERARRMQERIESRVGELGERGESGDRGAHEARIAEIVGEKERLEEEVGALESQIDRVARQARSAEKDAARRLAEAAESIRENQLKEKIRYSKGVVRGRAPEYAQRFEQEIGADLEEMSERLAEAGRAVGGSQQDQAAGALEGARDLVRRLESFEAGLQDRGAQRRSERPGQGDEEGAEPGSRSDREGGEERQADDRQQEGQGSREGQGGREGEGPHGERDGDGERGSEGRRLAQRGQEEGAGQPGSQGEPGKSGQEQAGGDGESASARGATTSRIGQGVPGWYQPGIFSPEDLRQMGAEFEQRVREAEGLRDDLRQLGLPAQDLEAILRRMREWSVRGVNQDPLALEELRAQVIEGLRQFEYRLWRDIEGEGGDRLFLAGADEVPPGFRELVEEYYKSLASRK